MDSLTYHADRFDTVSRGALTEESKVILEIPVSREAIRNMVKNKLRPHKNDYWCIPAKEAAEFIACIDEKPYRFLGEAGEPLTIISRSDIKRIPNIPEIELSVYFPL